METTRRDILKLGLAALASTRIAKADLVKSQLGSDWTSHLVKEERIEFPYVEDGLISMWDGEWNTGIGEHDNTTPIWRNLVDGSPDLAIGSGGEWGINSLICLGKRIPAVSEKNGGLLTAGSPMSVTVVTEIESDGIIFTLGHGNQQGGVSFVKSGSDIVLSYVSSAGLGKRNRITTPKTFVSVSANFEDRDVVYATVNGDETAPFYRFGGSYSTWITVGDRYNDSSAPFTGKVFSIRVYDRVLSKEELDKNYQVDMVRFSLQ